MIPVNGKTRVGLTVAALVALCGAMFAAGGQVASVNDCVSGNRGRIEKLEGQYEDLCVAIHRMDILLARIGDKLGVDGGVP